jgi:phospholipid/cholesterol/gamma-HCH transport system substrate-binding protein
MGRPRVLLAIGLAMVLVASVFVVVRSFGEVTRTRVVAYFINSSGLFPGDDVRILGVPVGKVDKIEPQPERVKVSFWFDNKYKVPADAKAAILSPQLVTGRAIQLTPVYTSGPAMPDGAVIPKDRTAVPVEWDEVRAQLQKVADLLQPTKPGGVSTLGELIDTAADNLRGQGANIRDTVIKLSQAISALGDHSQDIFGTFKNLSTLVTALHDSSDLLEQLNGNLAAVTGLLADDPNKVGQAVEDLNSVVGDVRSFTADNREAIGTTSDKLASITTALVQSLDDIKQTLHIAPDTIDNFNNIYEPANGSLTGALAVSNFSNPIGFLCGAVQAASRLRGDQAAKLCVQYLAPIVKNREWNFPPLGENLFVGAQARPNEVTYSEDWMRPDYVPGGPPPAAPGPGALLPAEAQPPAGPLPAEAPPPANPSTQLAAQAPPPAPTVSTDPTAGLPGMMVPPGGAS